MGYIFTLKYQLADHDSDLDLLVERLGAAGCDDALAGVGQPGRLALEFSREAESAEEAVRTALADVVGISRQAMRKLMLAHRATFPMPVHEGSASIWHLAEVLDWLSAASPRTIARPGPRPPPVTMAALPSSCPPLIGSVPASGVPHSALRRQPRAAGCGRSGRNPRP